ncbi:hypothetical protein E2A64_16405 [Pseudohoeflea suaedae]|uniref:Uncharacterized protein n=1 Tax=Pseudohoeflea suaedae TaxID=877384 RepID=A0A4R5PH80_9HYPH|nr:hypothetical protein [Pseudohoeflea suaedae]TDH34256.1 hypothetical protein E2A64_16405 [Pseudohoeflea suaedae]
MTAAVEKISTPPKLTPREKAAATDEAARAIIDAEATRREKKTERLRQMRLEREAAEAKRQAMAEKIAAAASAKAKKAPARKKTAAKALAE